MSDSLEYIAEERMKKAQALLAVAKRWPDAHLGEKYIYAPLAPEDITEFVCSTGSFGATEVQGACRVEGLLVIDDSYPPKYMSDAPEPVKQAVLKWLRDKLTRK